MKHCSKCGKSYQGPWSICLSDGTPLVEEIDDTDPDAGGATPAPSAVASGHEKVPSVVTEIDDAVTREATLPETKAAEPSAVTAEVARPPASGAIDPDLTMLVNVETLSARRSRRLRYALPVIGAGVVTGLVALIVVPGKQEPRSRTVAPATADAARSPARPARLGRPDAATRSEAARPDARPVAPDVMLPDAAATAPARRPKKLHGAKIATKPHRQPAAKSNKQRRRGKPRRARDLEKTINPFSE